MNSILLNFIIILYSIAYKQISDLIAQNLLGLIICNFRIEEYNKIVIFGIYLSIFISIVDFFNFFMFPQYQIKPKNNMSNMSNIFSISY